MFSLNLDGFGALLIYGVITTLAITASAALVGGVLGLLMAAAKMSRYAVLRSIAGTYTAVVRGVPDLLIIFLVYYGGSTTVSAVMGRPVEVNAFVAGTFALAFVFGAYAAEIFRGAISEIPQGQREAAHALGISRFKSFAYVVMPQAWKLALPAFGNQLTVLLKETSLVSLVGLEDLMRKTTIAVEATNKPFLFYMVAGALYLMLSLGIGFALKQRGRKPQVLEAQRG